LIIFFYLLSNVLAAQGQNDIYHFYYQVHDNGNNTYGNSTEFNTANITSDYGKRYYAGSEWHKGVDFGNGAPTNRWDHFTSLNTGIIRKLQGDLGYKYIITEGTVTGEQHHFGYGHIFEHLAPNPSYKRGDLILSKLDNVPFQYAIINFTEGSAFGPVQGTVTYDGVPYTVVTGITEGDVLGNIGKSNNNGNYEYMHVHVYMFENINVAIGNQGQGSHSNHFNDRDPLEFISHVNTAYDVAISTDNSVMDENVVVSSGAEAIGLKVRYSMQNANPSGSIFTNVVMDIDDVDLVIKESYLPDEDYNLIMGKYVESKLSHGARLESEIYPIKAAYGNNANPINNTEIDLVSNIYGDFNHTGIDPYAYRDGNNQPYDDYYFSDFYTRVHEDYQLGATHIFANANQEAKYKDGKHQLFAKVTTVRGAEYTSIVEGTDTPEIIIDNFKPFIQKVEIYKENASQPEYSRAWVWANDHYQIEPIPSGLNFDVNDDISVVVTTSESMEKVILSLNGYYNELTESEDEEKTIWNFEVADEYVSDGDNQLIIDGKDLANNDIQNFISSSAEVPVRTGPET